MQTEFCNSIKPSKRYKYYKVYMPSLRSASVHTPAARGVCAHKITPLILESRYMFNIFARQLQCWNSELKTGKSKSFGFQRD